MTSCIRYSTKVREKVTTSLKKLNEIQTRQPCFFVLFVCLCFQIQTNFLIRWSWVEAHVTIWTSFTVFHIVTIWKRILNLVNDIQPEDSDIIIVHTRISPTAILFWQFLHEEQCKAVIFWSYFCFYPPTIFHNELCCPFKAQIETKPT